MAAEESLEHFMARYQAGDLSAFDALYARVVGRVFKFLSAMTMDRARAEDLCQTVFLKVHRARAGWLPGSPVMPWIMTITRNTLYDDTTRRKRARVRVTSTGELPELVDIDEIDRAAAREAPAFDLGPILAAAIDELPELQREALALTKQGGLSIREAAVVLGTTETAVKLRVHRAYEALRAALGQHRGRGS